MSAESLAIPRTLGRWDLVLLKIVAIVNINNVPPVAVYGWASLGLWALYERRQFRYAIPEITQLLLGLSIPFLLVSHWVGVLRSPANNDVVVR